jgi:hypothetical protein
LSQLGDRTTRRSQAAHTRATRELFRRLVSVDASELGSDRTMTVRAVQRQIAANWQALYTKVFGLAPTC